nr:toprim domain-containing protein [Pseudorhizobium banfieldiae]
MPSLRFHPGLKLGDERYPALIGGVQSRNRKLTAVWRIFLRQDGTVLKDADGKKVKLGLGPAVGGAVRLGPVGETLRLTEGIETGLGVALLTSSKASVWATLSTSGMINFEIPEGVKRLEIYADGDRHRLNKRTGDLMDPPGIAAAKQLQERARKEGVEAVLFPSPEPDDWLDVWVQRKKDEQRFRTVQYR